MLYVLCATCGLLVRPIPGFVYWERILDRTTGKLLGMQYHCKFCVEDNGRGPL